MEDLLRLAVDRATLISAPVLNTGAITSRVLAQYITSRPFHCILTGSHSLDGGSASVPVELAEILGLDQMLGVIGIDPDRFDTVGAVIDVAEEGDVVTYEIAMPCVLSLTRESGYKLPYAKLTDMRRDVSDELIVVSADDPGVLPFTTVVNRYPKTFREKERQVVGTDDAGIEKVFDFLKAKGFLSR
ncbi:MAG: hypothetical protein MI802_25460 [Desulfobacterales bacterium]|nr:hypothetical protein [Desulfobacterales bacterium]